MGKVKFGKEPTKEDIDRMYAECKYQEEGDRDDAVYEAELDIREAELEGKIKELEGLRRSRRSYWR